MKTIGIIGGMSYESSIHYYKRINDQVNAIAGGLTCARMLIWNVNFEPIRQHMLAGEWDAIGAELSDIAKRLEAGGADYIVIATNTMHKLADQVQAAVKVPVIHIADCVAEKCKEKGVKKVGLLGTKYTMEQDFLKDRLAWNGLEVAVPRLQEHIDGIDDIIFGELCKGVVLDDSREYYKSVIAKMKEEDGIEGVILGCTEIEMLIKPQDLDIPVFDTTQSHIDAIVDYCLERR